MFTVLPETVERRGKHYFLPWVMFLCSCFLRFCTKSAATATSTQIASVTTVAKTQMIFSLVLTQLQVGCNVAFGRSFCQQCCLTHLLQQRVVSAPPHAAAARRQDEATLRVWRASSRRTHQNANERGGNFQLKARCSWCILTICGGGGRVSVLCVTAGLAAIESEQAGCGQLSILLDTFLCCRSLSVHLHFVKSFWHFARLSYMLHPRCCLGGCGSCFLCEIANRTPTGNTSPECKTRVETQSRTVTLAEKS